MGGCGCLHVYEHGMDILSMKNEEVLVFLGGKIQNHNKSRTSSGGLGLAFLTSLLKM